MQRPIIFWGASGHAKVLHEFMPELGYELVALVDNQADIISPFKGVPVLHGRSGLETWLEKWTGEPLAALIAIGGWRGKDRLELQAQLAKLGIKPVIAIHPTSFVAADARLGEGTQVLAQSAVCADASLGPACIVNTRASVDHEGRIGAGVHIAPGATLAGCVEVGDYSFIGTGASVLPRVKIGTNSIVGAGAVVTKNVPDNVVVVGNPARITRPNV